MLTHAGDYSPALRSIFFTTAGMPPSTEPLHTESGREVRSGDIVAADDPIVLAPCDGTGATIEIGFNIAGRRISRSDPDDVSWAAGRGCLDCGTGPGDLCFCATPRTGSLAGMTNESAHVEQERVATWDRVLP